MLVTWSEPVPDGPSRSNTTRAPSRHVTPAQVQQSLASSQLENTLSRGSLNALRNPNNASTVVELHVAALQRAAAARTTTRVTRIRVHEPKSPSIGSLESHSYGTTYVLPLKHHQLLQDCETPHGALSLLIFMQENPSSTCEDSLFTRNVHLLVQTWQVQTRLLQSSQQVRSSLWRLPC